MAIQTLHEADRVSERHWKWSIWQEGPEDELDRLESVTYHLHPTFANPIRNVSDPASGFILRGSGWGQFMVFLELHFKDGHVESDQHWLSFSDGAHTKEGPTRALSDDRPQAVFLSYSIVDEELAQEIRSDLERRGVEVMDVSGVGPGEPMDAAVAEMLDRADAAIALVSDYSQSSSWAAKEVEMMRERELPVLPVLVETDLPEQLKAMKPVRMARSDDARMVTEAMQDMGFIREAPRDE